MQPLLQKPQHSRLGPRIQSWIDAIEPGTPEVPKSKDSRKRPSQQTDNNPRPPKRANRQALTATAGNIMPPPKIPMPPPVQQKDTPARNTRSSPTRRPETPAKATQAIPQGRPQRNVVEQEEVTQVPDNVSSPDHRIPLGMPRPAFQMSPTGNAWGTSNSGGQPTPVKTPKSSSDYTEYTGEGSRGRSSNKSRGTAKSHSPTKKLADFRMAKKPTVLGRLGGSEAREAGGVLGRYPALVRARYGEGVIPSSLKKMVEKYVDSDDLPPANWYGENSGYDKQMGRKLVEIWEKAFECERDEVDEPTWNSSVHEPLMKLVIDNPRYTKGSMACTGITTARINPSSISMYNLSGLKMQDKMVGFALQIKFQDPEIQKRVRYTIRDMRVQSLSQTDYPPLRMDPIFLTTETKIPFSGGPIAAAQLITWGSAGLVKLHSMLESNKQEEEAIPPMPLLTFYGHEVYFSAIQEGKDENTFRGQFYLGSTSTIVGLFQLFRALDALVEWGHTDYREWYLSKVLREV